MVRYNQYEALDHRVALQPLGPVNDDQATFQFQGMVKDVDN